MLCTQQSRQQHGCPSLLQMILFQGAASVWLHSALQAVAVGLWRGTCLGLAPQPSPKRMQGSGRPAMRLWRAGMAWDVATAPPRSIPPGAQLAAGSPASRPAHTRMRRGPGSFPPHASPRWVCCQNICSCSRRLAAHPQLCRYHLWRISTWLQGTLPCNALGRLLLGVCRSQGTHSRHPFRAAAAPLQTRFLCSSLVLLELGVGRLPLLHWWYTLQSSHHQETAARLRQMTLPSNGLLKRKAALPQLMQLLAQGPAAHLLQMVLTCNSLLKRKAALLQPPYQAAGALSWSAPLLQLLGRPACYLIVTRPPCSQGAGDPKAISMGLGGCLPSV